MLVQAAYLGEICIATYRELSDGNWMILAEKAACYHILVRNLYKDAKECELAISMLIPEPCRQYIRWC